MKQLITPRGSHKASKNNFFSSSKDGSLNGEEVKSGSIQNVKILQKNNRTMSSTNMLKNTLKDASNTNNNNNEQMAIQEKRISQLK